MRDAQVVLGYVCTDTRPLMRTGVLIEPEVDAPKYARVVDVLDDALEGRVVQDGS
jgi:hypothetical protein